MKELTVTIHSKDAHHSYMSNTSCPLAVSLKEQHPDLGIPVVGGDDVHFYPLHAYYGPSSSKWAFDDNVWNATEHEKLRMGKIDNVVLTLKIVPMQTKTLDDGSVVPHRIWDYAFRWAIDKGYTNIPLMQNKRIDDLSAREFWQLFDEAIKSDIANHRNR